MTINDLVSDFGASLRAATVYGYASAVALSLAMAPAQAQTADGDLAFDFAITLSSKTAAKLTAAHEGITVWASFYGEPKPEAERHVNEIGMIDLGMESFELPGQAGAVHISGRAVGVTKLNWIKGQPKVNVNLYTSRKSSDQNLIECDLIDGEVKKMQEKKITVHCVLIGEAYENKTFP